MGFSSARMAWPLRTPCGCLIWVTCALNTRCATTYLSRLWLQMSWIWPRLPSGNDHAIQHNPCNIEQPIQRPAWLSNGDDKNIIPSCNFGCNCGILFYVKYLSCQGRCFPWKRWHKCQPCCCDYIECQSLVFCCQPIVKAF